MTARSTSLPFFSRAPPGSGGGGGGGGVGTSTPPSHVTGQVVQCPAISGFAAAPPPPPQPLRRTRPVVAPGATSRQWAQQSHMRHARTAELFRLPDEPNFGRPLSGCWAIGNLKGRGSKTLKARGERAAAQESVVASSGAAAPRTTLPAVRSESHLGMVKAVYLGRSSGASARDSADETELDSMLDASAVEVDYDEEFRKELAALKTGEDAIRFFSKNSGGIRTQTELLYCNRVQGGGPMDLVVVSGERCLPEHFTVSVKGVVHVQPGQLCECTPLAEWLHQSLMLRVLSSMSIFRTWPQRKAIADWRSGAKYSEYCKKRHHFAQNCFFAKPVFVGPIMEAVYYISAVHEVPVVEIQEKNYSLKEFMAIQQDRRTNSTTGAQREIEEQRDGVVSVLETLAVTLEALARDAQMEEIANSGNRPSSGPPRPKPSKSKSMVQEKQEARQRATRLRVSFEDLARIREVVRVADYMLNSALVALGINTSKEIADWVSVQAASGSGHARGLLTVRASTISDASGGTCVKLDTTKEIFAASMNQYWDETFQMMDSLPSAASAKPFIRQMRDWRPPEVSKAVRSNVTFVDDCARTVQLVGEHLIEAQAFSELAYGPYSRIESYGKKWDPAAWASQAHTNAKLMQEMDLMAEFHEDLTNIRTQKKVGVLMMDARRLKADLNAVAETVLASIKPSLMLVSRSACVHACQTVDRAIFSLDRRPHEDADHGTYAANYEKMFGRQRAIREAAEEVRMMQKHLKKHGARLSMDDELQLETLQAKERDFVSRALPEAAQFLEERRGSKESTPEGRQESKGSTYEARWSSDGEESSGETSRKHSLRSTSKNKSGGGLGGGP
eukprot:TRINITY_DN24605_c0_g1_i1.p1 TRINITY_DN24605_c0_g1~~TRINITY_DN24605_c0_g1_i1.p1  ORF type:complete len:845 (+),score=172.65 TRINITY_DN24605_c0_g1_i1:34-2568(+)